MRPLASTLQGLSQACRGVGKWGQGTYLMASSDWRAATRRLRRVGSSWSLSAAVRARERSPALATLAFDFEFGSGSFGCGREGRCGRMEGFAESPREARSAALFLFFGRAQQRDHFCMR